MAIPFVTMGLVAEGVGKRSPHELFIIAVMMQAVIPLAPVLVSLIRFGHVSDYLLVVTAPLYTLALAGSCSEPLPMMLNLVVGVLLLACFGLGLDADPNKLQLMHPSRIAIAIATLVCVAGYGIDRWRAHVGRKEPFGVWQLA
jgi:hypothetical protein